MSLCVNLDAALQCRCWMEFPNCIEKLQATMIYSF